MAARANLDHDFFVSFDFKLLLWTKTNIYGFRCVTLSSLTHNIYIQNILVAAKYIFGYCFTLLKDQ